MAKIKPMRIPGNWREGYALDYHTLKSEFLGYDPAGHPIFETTRTEVGELLYQLKYGKDPSVAKSLGNRLVEIIGDFIAAWNPGLNLIVPVPPSRQRNSQPVWRIAYGLSDRLKIPLCRGCVVKAKRTPELKNVFEYETRLKLLDGAFTVKRSALEGQTVLLFDDLYRSGATLNAVAALVRREGKVADVYALAVTRTRSAL